MHKYVPTQCCETIDRETQQPLMDKFLHCILHCKNKIIVKVTNLLVSTVAKNSENCNFIGRVGCYGYTCNYNLIIVISISLCCLINVQRNRISILIESL